MTRSNRRFFLKSVAGSALAWPFVRAFGQTLEAPPKRLVIVMQNNGTQQANFWPRGGNFTSPILTPILGSPVLAPQTRLIKGVYVPNDANRADANQHDMGFARMFTGGRLMAVGGKPWASAASVDQILAKERGIESLALAVLASRVEPHPFGGKDHRKSFSYVGPGQHKVPILDPYIAFQRNFAGPMTGQPSAETVQRLRLRKSILDGLEGDLRDLSAKLGPSERAKLDLHATALRELERRVDEGEVAKETCEPPATPRNFTEIDPTLLISKDDAIPELVDTMVSLISTSLICNITSVATLQLGYCGGKWSFGWEGINRNFHDDVAHRDTSDAGSSPENTDWLVRGNRYYAGVVAKLASQLAAVPEGDGTVLDNTLIVWANEFGRGDHSLENIPIVMIGGAGGALPPGGRLIDEGRQVFNRLGCTVLNAMGHPADGFGDQQNCGIFRGL